MRRILDDDVYQGAALDRNVLSHLLRTFSSRRFSKLSTVVPRKSAVHFSRRGCFADFFCTVLHAFVLIAYERALRSTRSRSGMSKV